MKRALHINFVSFIIILLPFWTKAQYLDEYKKLGDKAFVKKEYYGAAYYYKKAANGLALSSTIDIPYQATGKTSKVKPAEKAQVIYRLAESYRGYENYIEAEAWYYRLLTDYPSADFPLARLWYGICLRANQRFDESIKQLEQFKQAYLGDKKYQVWADKEIANCKFAKEQYANPVKVDVLKKKAPWNSDGSNYALIRNAQGFWFTSSRSTDDAKKVKRRLNALYYAAANASAPQKLNIGLSDDAKLDDVEYGTPAMLPSGNQLYFTRWYRAGAKEIHALYTSKKVSGKWGDPEKLNNNINLDGYNAIQPYVTADGKYLFFASDKPGGKGGYDIWMSELRDGMPISSTNLGDKINTAMDEQAPAYFIKEKKLVYSSKGFTGLGGFDFVSSTGAGTQWTTAANLGYPLNSAKDDLYYSPDPADSARVFISSDRESDCCLELYELTLKKDAPKVYALAGQIIDCKTQLPVSGAKVTLLDSATKNAVQELLTDEKGEYTYAYTGAKSFIQVTEKQNYFSKTSSFVNGVVEKSVVAKPVTCLQPYEVGKPIVLNNILYDFNKATLRPQSKTELDNLAVIMNDNPKISVQLSAHTDAIGKYMSNMKLSQARAQACVNYLIEKGIAQDRLVAKGYGEEKPVAPNKLKNGKDNPKGRQLNRRTEFTVER